MFENHHCMHLKDFNIYVILKSNIVHLSFLASKLVQTAISPKSETWTFILTQSISSLSHFQSTKWDFILKINWDFVLSNSKHSTEKYEYHKWYFW